MSSRVPQYLSSPMQIMWFESDEFAIMVILFTLAMVFGGWTMWGLFFFGTWGYIKAKNKYPQGFLKHMIYFAGLKEMAYYPGPFEKEFNE
jgi:type IV conjugative transfer system protein TraL